MGDEASQFVGEIPENYDRSLGPVIFEDYADDLAQRAAAIGAGRVLELAAGTGIVSRKLKDALGERAHLTVTDLNAAMLDVARAKFKSDEGVEFIPADAMQLDFSDNEADLIICQFGVMFFPDKIAAFREALRVLRPGGSYLFSTWGPMAKNPFAQIAHEVAARLFPVDPPVFYQVPFSYPDPETISKDMSAAGFRDIDHDTVAIKKSVKDWGGFAHGLVYGNPLIDEIRRRGEVDADGVKGAIETALRGAFGPEPSQMPLEASVFHGRAQ